MIFFSYISMNITTLKDIYNFIINFNKNNDGYILTFDDATIVDKTETELKSNNIAKAKSDLYMKSSKSFKDSICVVNINTITAACLLTMANISSNIIMMFDKQGMICFIYDHALTGIFRLEHSILDSYRIDDDEIIIKQIVINGSKIDALKIKKSTESYILIDKYKSNYTFSIKKTISSGNTQTESFLLNDYKDHTSDEIHNMVKVLKEPEKPYIYIKIDGNSFQNIFSKKSIKGITMSLINGNIKIINGGSSSYDITSFKKYINSEEDNDVRISFNSCLFTTMSDLVKNKHEHLDVGIEILQKDIFSTDTENNKCRIYCFKDSYAILMLEDEIKDIKINRK